MRTFRRRTRIPVSADELFAWHVRPGAFERLTPPWERVRLLEHEGVGDGTRAVLELGTGLLRRRWVAVHEAVVPGRQFADVQESGPFAEWRHVHRFIPDGAQASFLEDAVDYRVPFGAAGELVAGRIAERKLERLFAFRHQRTLRDLVSHRTTQLEPMRIAVTGSTGLIGTALSSYLTTGGHTVVPIVRDTPVPGSAEVRWDPEAGAIDASGLEGVDAVIHLAGESISRRWTASRKRAILESRRRGTRLIAGAIAALASRPRVLACASAIGYYGSRGDELLTEESPPGEGFLPEVCTAWEAAADPAREAGIRVVHLRQGVILEGLLARMATPFKLGLGGVIGDGRQYLSWIALDDVVRAFHAVLADQRLSGPVNAVTPTPVRNTELTKTLGRVVGRPTIVPLPAFAARALFGELADGLLLASTRVKPARLEAAGFEFDHPDLEGALRHVLGR